MLYGHLWGECSFLLKILTYSRKRCQKSLPCADNWIIWRPFWELWWCSLTLSGRAEEKAGSSTDCRDGLDSGEAPLHQSPTMCAVMGGGVQLECTGKLQFVGNYIWLANKMLFCRSFKPIVFLMDNSFFPPPRKSPNYCAPALTSTQSEKAIQADQTGTLQFQGNYWKYEINFKGEASVCLISDAGGIWLVLQCSMSCTGKACRPGQKRREKLFTDFKQSVLQQDGGECGKKEILC